MNTVADDTPINVYLDGEFVDTVYTEYGAFTCDVGALTTGKHTITAETIDSSSMNAKSQNKTLLVGYDIQFLEYPQKLIQGFANQFRVSVSSESTTITVTLSGEVVKGHTVVFKNGNTVLGAKTSNSNGEASYTYNAQGLGDITITAECGEVSNSINIEDCTYVDTTTYTSDTSKDISLPSKFKLEFDLYPKNRSTSNGGASHYVKCSRTQSAQDIWFGQGTSSGSHGIMVRPSTNSWATYEYLIDFNNISGLNSFSLVNHRMASDVETDQAIIPCVSDEGDANMVMYECRLTYQW